MTSSLPGDAADDITAPIEHNSKKLFRYRLTLKTFTYGYI